MTIVTKHAVPAGRIRYMLCFTVVTRVGFGPSHVAFDFETEFPTFADIEEAEKIVKERNPGCTSATCTSTYRLS